MQPSKDMLIVSDPGLFPLSPDPASLTIIIDEKGEPWWVAKEVCDVLGYANSRDAVRKHCKHTIKDGVAKRDAIGRVQKFAIIPEGNLMRLVTKSKLPEADKFEKWVFDEVLPHIRMTGRMP